MSTTSTRATATALERTHAGPADGYRLTLGDRGLAVEVAHSATMPVADGGRALFAWLGDHDRHSAITVVRADLADLAGWVDDRDAGVIRHHTGRFFSVEGLDVHMPGVAVPHWQQPIIHQPEVGVLGILATRIDGVLHFLMQAKVEPGNPGGRHQLSPTVQATRSNYTRAHGGRAVPYLDHFVRQQTGDHVLVDVRQSEQGAWFLRKRNRNMVVEVDAGADRIEVLDGFRWCSLAEIYLALATEDVVNMDSRTVLSCLPLEGEGLADLLDTDVDGFRGATGRSMLGTRGSLHRTDEILQALSAARTEADVSATRIRLDRMEGWRRVDGAIVHETGAFFAVVGIDVRAAGREVAEWSQPMFATTSTGLACLVVAEIDGVLHALLHLRCEPGLLDGVELAPTVQCTPENYRHLPPAARPPYLDLVTAAPAACVRFDTVMSEEGGRFLDTVTRYVILQAPEPPEALEHPSYRWLTMAQLVDLLRHSHYLNVQARSLVICLQALALARPAHPPPLRPTPEPP